MSSGLVPTRRRVTDRVTALCGLGSIVLFVLGTELVAPSPGSDASIATSSDVLARTLADNAEAAETGATCLLAGVLLLIVFVGRLHGLLAALAPPGSWMPGAALIAGAAVVAAQLVGVTLALAASSPDGYVADVAVAKTILLLGWNGAFLLAPGLAALIVVGTVAAFTTGLLPRWTGWLGALLVTVLVALAAAGTVGLAVLPGFLWLTVLSVTLAVRPPATVASPRRTEEVEPEPSPA